MTQSIRRDATKNKIQTRVWFAAAPSAPPIKEDKLEDVAAINKKHYFDNAKVEELLTVYVDGGCTDVGKRDEIMSHAAELIRQIIRAHNFEQIFPGRDESSFMELFQVAWMQIEKTLYKYDPRPGSPKVFNMWSQIAKTRILAYLKKEKRDRKNVGSYRDFIIRRHKTRTKAHDDFVNFLKEAKRICSYNDDFKEIVDGLDKLYRDDEKPYDGFITKLEKITGKPRLIINNFLRTVRMRCDEFHISIIEPKDCREADLTMDENVELD